MKIVILKESRSNSMFQTHMWIITGGSSRSHYCVRPSEDGTLWNNVQSFNKILFEKDYNISELTEN